MKFTYLITALAVFSNASAFSEPAELDERAPISRPAKPPTLSKPLTFSKPPFSIPTRPTLPTISNNPLGFATKTHSVSTYGFFTKPSFPTLSPPKPSGVVNGTNLTSTSEDARNNPDLPNGPLHRGNWLPGFDINTDISKSWPNTGRTVRYEWRIQNTTLSPDGTPQQMLVVNGQYPGPLLEANWGDRIEITVHNDLRHNGTGIHWHGFRQLLSNSEDGVPGITECPIAPGSSKVYSFQATGYGTTWYHSHFSSQYGDGVIGPVIIRGPTSANWDIDLGTILVSDWYAPLTAFQADWYAHRFGPPTASNYLLNGKNIKLDGSTGTRATWTFTPGKKHLMRFVNSGVDNHFKMQLDGHTFTVVAADNTPIVPYQTKELSIANGQRYDVIVTADQSVSNYYLRALNVAACGRNRNSGTGTANGIIKYTGAPDSLPVVASPAALLNAQCVDEPLSLLKPVVTIPVDPTGFAAQFATLPMTLRGASLATGENVFLWYLNGVSQNIDWSAPTIETVADNATISSSENPSALLPQIHNVISLTQPDKWTFWVVQNQFFVPHPMHLHGHDFAVLGQGTGTFNPTQHLSQLNFVNPNRRDVANLVASGWTVVAFKTDNPGSWLFHCHVAWHVGGGLSLQFLELPAKIPELYGSKISGRGFQDTCRQWDQYFGSAADIYGKSDSGLKKRSALLELEPEPQPEAKAEPEPTPKILNEEVASPGPSKSMLSRLQSKLPHAKIWGSTNSPQPWLHNGRWAYNLEFDGTGIMSGFKRWVGMDWYRGCGWREACMRAWEDKYEDYDYGDGEEGEGEEQGGL